MGACGETGYFIHRNRGRAVSALGLSHVKGLGSATAKARYCKVKVRHKSLTNNRKTAPLNCLTIRLLTESLLVARQRIFIATAHAPPFSCTPISDLLGAGRLTVPLNSSRGEPALIAVVVAGKRKRSVTAVSATPSRCCPNTRCWTPLSGATTQPFSPDWQTRGVGESRAFHPGVVRRTREVCITDTARPAPPCWPIWKLFSALTVCIGLGPLGPVLARWRGRAHGRGLGVGVFAPSGLDEKQRRADARAGATQSFVASTAARDWVATTQKMRLAAQRLRIAWRVTVANQRRLPLGLRPRSMSRDGRGAP